MSFEQYALVGGTIRSFLARLHHEGKIDALFEKESLLWQTK